jgi:hypothetical protein
MMGERAVAQEALFYSISLERHVPADHLLRSIDRFMNLSNIPEHYLQGRSTSALTALAERGLSTWHPTVRGTVGTLSPS